MKKILVPVDFSPNSEHALAYAVLLAERLCAEITVWHSCLSTSDSDLFFRPGGFYGSAGKETEKAVLEKTEKMAKPYRERFCTAGKPLVVNTLIRSGFVIDEINEAIEELEIDLVVMGTKGATGAERVFIGSITAGVADNIRVPLLAIPEDASLKFPERIVYATDFRTTDIQTIDKLLAVTENTDSEIICLHVTTGTDDEEADETKLRALEQAYDLPIFKKRLSFERIKKKRITEAIEVYASENEIDLIAVSKQKRNFLEKLFLPSVSSRLTYDALCPVLILKNFAD